MILSLENCVLRNRFGDVAGLKMIRDAILAALKAYGYDGEMNFEVFGFQMNLPKESLSASLSFAAAVGRQMISALEYT